MSVIAGGSIALGSPAQGQTSPSRPAQTTPPADRNQPIVPDSQFEEALPPLDPDLNRPLEPIETIEPVNPNATPFPPVPGPVEDAPLGDPSLSEPLPPIATFDVQPLEAETEGSDQPATVRYALVIEGLEPIGLEDEFRDLSALEDARGEAANGAMIVNRAREDEALAVRLLRAEGYYDAVATHSIEQVPAEGQVQSLRVVISIVPGQRYNFGEIRIDSPPLEPAQLAREALPLATGAPIRAIDVEAAEANVLLRLPQQGYPFPEIGTRDILLDPESGAGDYTLPLQPGPRARFAGFTTEGEELAFGPEHVGILARFERGQLYDRRLVDDLREAMVATRLFDTVSAEPVRTGETAPDGTEYVNILVRQDAGPARSLDASAGFSTGEGLRLEGAWEHRNLFPPEGALRAAAIAGTSEQSVNLSFRRSNAGQRDRTVLVQAEVGRRDYAAFRGYTARVAGLISRESTPIWQKVWTWAYGAELIATNERQFRISNDPDPEATYFIAGLTGQLGYDRSDNLLNPTRGFRLLGRTNPELSLENGTNPYIRNQIDGSVYIPAGDNLVIAGRARFGSIFGAHRTELAPSRRFYAGGGGSVRGFGFQQLGPKIEVANPKFDPDDPDEEDSPTILIPIGGRSLTEFALEGRYRFGDYGVVGFVDAGRVGNSELPGFSELRFGVGVGGRLYTNFGPLRVDIATPVARRRGESLIAVYVSIGQAF